MKKIILAIAILSVIGFVTSSCKKKDTTPTPTTTTPAATAAAFTWTFGGATATADSSYAYATYHTVYAHKGAKASGFTDDFFEIDLDNFNIGTHSLSSSNALTYIKAAGASNTATAFSLNITANASNKMTGTFTATMTTGGSMTGTFTDIPVR